MHYLQNSKLNKVKTTPKNNKGVTQIVYDLQINQKWKVNTDKAQQILPYALRHLQLSRLCQSFHHIKFLFSQAYQSTNIDQVQENIEIIQNNSHQNKQQQSQIQKMINLQRIQTSRKLFKVVWKFTRRRLLNCFQIIRQSAGIYQEQSSMYSNDSNNSQYLRYIKWKSYQNLTKQQQHQIAIDKIQIVYKQKKEKLLIQAFLNLMQYDYQLNYRSSQKSRSNKKDVSISNDAIYLFEQIIMRKKMKIVQDSFKILVQDYYQKIAEQYYGAIQNGWNILNRFFKKNTLRNKNQSFYLLKIYSQNQYQKYLKQLSQRKSNKSSNFKSINKLKDTNSSNNNSLQKKQTINKFQRNNLNTQNKKWSLNNSKDTAKRQKSARNNEYINEFHKDQFQNQIHQLPTKRINGKSSCIYDDQFKISKVENNVKSETLFKLSQFKSSNTQNTRFQQQQQGETERQTNNDLHIPVTQRLKNKNINDSQYEQNNQDNISLQQYQQEQNIIQQIYIIRDFSSHPKRKPDDYLKIPIVSTNINLVQIPAQKQHKNYEKQMKIHEQKVYTKHNQSFYIKKSCQNCDYCKNQGRRNKMMQEIIQKLNSFSIMNDRKIVQQEKIIKQNVINIKMQKNNKYNFVDESSNINEYIKYTNNVNRIPQMIIKKYEGFNSNNKVDNDCSLDNLLKQKHKSILKK